MDAKSCFQRPIKCAGIGTLVAICVSLVTIGPVKPVNADSSFSFSIATDSFHIGYRSVDGGYRYWTPGCYDRYHRWRDGYYSGPVVYAPASGRGHVFRGGSYNGDGRYRQDGFHGSSGNFRGAIGYGDHDGGGYGGQRGFGDHSGGGYGEDHSFGYHGGGGYGHEGGSAQNFRGADRQGSGGGYGDSGSGYRHGDR